MRARPAPTLVWALGWGAGWLLGWRLPRLPSAPTASPPPADRTGGSDPGELPVAVIVPARDEERTIGPLLASLAAQAPGPQEVVVVDDGSTDATATVAASAGVRVVAAGDLPGAWTGKAWACATGVAATDAPILVLLDADVRLGPGALAALVHERDRRGGLLSVLPDHRPERPYEQLSAPFNLVSVMGSGAAVPGADGRTTVAFGPCLVLDRDDLESVGGFAAVADEVVEDIALGTRFAEAGLAVHALAGGSTVWFRMYPDGIGHLCEGWTKNMAAGAGAVSPVRSGLVALWVAGAVGPVLTIARRRGSARWPVLALAASGIQLLVLARRIGRFPWWTAPAQPVLMAAFVALFGRSAWHRSIRRSARWKGRTIARPHDAQPERTARWSRIRSSLPRL